MPINFFSAGLLVGCLTVAFYYGELLFRRAFIFDERFLTEASSFLSISFLPAEIIFLGVISASVALVIFQTRVWALIAFSFGYLAFNNIPVLFQNIPGLMINYFFVFLCFIAGDRSSLGTSSFLRRTGFFLLSFHLSTIYFFSGISKVSGTWLSGWVIRDTVERAGIYGIDFIPFEVWVILSYWTVFLEITFFLVLFSRKWRKFVISQLVVMHLCIALGLGMFTFGMICVAMNLLILGQEEASDINWKKLLTKA